MSADTPEDVPSASTTASGQGSVAVGGDVRDSTVITGNSNVIYIGGRPIPWWRILAGLVVALAGAVASIWRVSARDQFPTADGPI